MARTLILEDDELALIVQLFKGGSGPFALAPVVERLRPKLEAAIQDHPASPPKARRKSNLKAVAKSDATD